MMMGNIAKVGATLGVALIALTGCASSANNEAYKNQGVVVEESPDNNVYVQDRMLKENSYTLSNGRTVTCLVLLGSHQGGLTCDWANAR